MKELIRKAEESDFDEWVKARCDLWPTTDREGHLSEIQTLIHDKKFSCYLALYENKIIGFLETYIRPFANGCDEQPVLFVEGIWVHKAWRRKRVAEGLIYHLEEWAKDNGHKEIGSDSALNNTSAHLAHKAWGFQETTRVVYFKKDLT